MRSQCKKINLDLIKGLIINQIYNKLMNKKIINNRWININQI